MADWDLFEPQAPPAPTAESVFAEIKSQTVQLGTGLEQSHTGTIEIRSNNNDAWYDLSNAYVEVKFKLIKVVDNVNTALDAADKATLINGGWSLFRRVELNFGDTNTIDAVDLPGKTHLIHAYSRYSASRLAECADAEFIYPENTAVTVGSNTEVPGANFLTSVSLGAAVLTDPIGHTPSAALRAQYLKRNPSFARRFARTRASRQVTLFLPLRSILGYCDNLNKPIRGIPFSLNLERNEEWTTFLHCTSDLAPNGGLKAIILNCSLWTPIVKPTVEVSGLINEQLSQEELTTSYVFENRTGYVSSKYNPGAAEQSIEWKIGTSVAKPTLIYIGFISEAMYDFHNDRLPVDAVPDEIQTQTPPGAMKQHKIANGGLLGSHLNDIKRVEIRINNKQYPYDPYVMTFATDSVAQKENWQRAYLDFKKVFFKDHPENSKIIDMATWMMAPVFAFKLDNDAGVFEKSKSVDITLRANVISDVTNGAIADATTGSGGFRAYAVVYSERQLKVQALDGRVVMYT